eukprot:TRINITY_DN56860_c0_g1_i1.p1 TRINITY_DN56860_c0_g1~~TRINITY_DN56860_c0_g1_i1.p1  ORF type:complete len:119 (+),score=13.27 TRINITY_DN56860_c0_g1_i1:33-359(+)
MKYRPYPDLNIGTSVTLNASVRSLQLQPTHTEALKREVTLRFLTAMITSYERQQKRGLLTRQAYDILIDAAERASMVHDFQTHYGLIAEIGRAVQQECRDRSRMPSSA